MNTYMHKWKGFSFLPLIVILFLVPLITRDPYDLHILITITIFAVLSVGLRLILITGQISVAQVAFYGIGAYASALLVLRMGWNTWLTMPMAGIIAGLVAVAVGYLALRLKGAYFIILTIAFGEVVRLVFMRWDRLFGGSLGLSGIPKPSPILGFEFGSKVEFYYLALLLALVAVAFMYRLEHSRFGLTFSAIREADVLAESVGINPMRYKVLAFAVACFFAGLVGAFYAHYTHFIAPYDFTFHDSARIIVFAIVGGRSKTLGPIIGAAFLIILVEVVGGFGEYIPFFYGTALIVILLFIPEGLISLPRSIVARFNVKNSHQQL